MQNAKTHPRAMRKGVKTGNLSDTANRQDGLSGAQKRVKNIYKLVCKARERVSQAHFNTQKLVKLL